jgi:catechol 2,3-dioxygenase
MSETALNGNRPRSTILSYESFFTRTNQRKPSTSAHRQTGTRLGILLASAGTQVDQEPGAQAVVSANGTGRGIIVLSEDRNAAPRPQRSIGLYHLAIRYPGRRELARAYRRLAERGYPISGASDHGVSEAIYLSDPDGNGVELYMDRPRDRWPWRNGQVEMETSALDLDSLTDLVADEPVKTKAPAETDLGHIHLHVADLAEAERFYGEFLGLAVTQRTYPGALFLAAGGYHHHVGVNVWAGKSAPPTNSVGLISYRFEVPITEILFCLGHRAPLLGYEMRSASLEGESPAIQIRDPNGNWLEVQASPTAAAVERPVGKG